MKMGQSSIIPNFPNIRSIFPLLFRQRVYDSQVATLVFVWARLKLAHSFYVPQTESDFSRSLDRVREIDQISLPRLSWRHEIYGYRFGPSNLKIDFNFGKFIKNRVMLLIVDPELHIRLQYRPIIVSSYLLRYKFWDYHRSLVSDYSWWSQANLASLGLQRSYSQLTH